jgi:hypothetical protein
LVLKLVKPRCSRLGRERRPGIRTYLDFLRERTSPNYIGAKKSPVVAGLKLVLAGAAVAVTAHRAAHLDPQLAGVEILEWTRGQRHLRAVDLRATWRRGLRRGGAAHGC